MSVLNSGKPAGGGAGPMAGEFAQHERWLRTTVLARLGEPQAVDEVMQEVALAATRQRSTLRDATRLPAWLYRLAVRQVLLYRRRHGRQRRLVRRFAETVGHAESSVGDPLGWLLSDERRRHVREALKRLSRRDREILLLKYTEDWSYHQLAEHLGISHSAVEARLHRARQKLRAELTALEVAGVQA